MGVKYMVETIGPVFRGSVGGGRSGVGEVGWVGLEGTV